MSRVWRTIKGYLLWTYDRGSFHYDVMVTLILGFIFVAPRFIDFKDKPTEIDPSRPGIVSFVYQAGAAAVDAQDEGMVRDNFVHLLRPLAGPVKVNRIEPVRDSAGHIVAYRAWVQKYDSEKN
jgi:hypothetical protein